ncbi:MAG: 5-histidylcysteine sulfoxide synthase [Crocinitomicaceae bacterium]|jgi:5-histidylcysteine sulfoxide synthase
MKDRLNMKTKIMSRGPVSLDHTKRSDLKDYFENAWEIYEELFSAIRSESTFYLAPDSLRHPLIFYYGHTAVFYVNKLILSGMISHGINPRFEGLFAKGVDPELPEHLAAEFKWPSVQEVREYRTEVYNLVWNVIDKMEIPEQTFSTDPIWNLHMAIEHDRIHFETSSVLIRQLNANQLERPSGWSYAPTFGFSEEFELVHVKGGRVTLGKTEPSGLYGWDNEYGQLTLDVKPFYATKNLVTNGEFINFVKKGGYQKDKYWSKEGLEWKTRTSANLPKFWIKKAENYAYRAMFDEIEMPLDWPAEVNAYEALAYCNFKGPEFRLLSEAEFKLLTKNVHPKVEPALSEQFNLQMKFGSPSPVGYFESQNGDAFNDLYGNVWDWLSDSFYALPGFKEHAHYSDFSLPYFGDDHRMLLGGSWATSGTGASQFYRLWFRDYFYQHAGFRLAKTVLNE